MAQVDSVIVVWPGGHRQAVAGIQVSQPIAIKEMLQATSVPAEVEGSLSLRQLGLFQNFPNPFNPETAIHYELFQRGLVVVEVYNLNG